MIHPSSHVWCLVPYFRMLPSIPSKLGKLRWKEAPLEWQASQCPWRLGRTVEGEGRGVLCTGGRCELLYRIGVSVTR